MHLLQQHIVDVHCSSQLLGKEIQNTLSDVLEKDFYTKLELILDQYSIENYQWEIENLLIDLPEISQKDWKKEFVNQTLLKIEEYLKDHFPVLELNKNKEKLEDFGFESQAKFAEKLFFEYLKTGIIAENSYSKNIDEINEAIEITEVFIEKIITIFNESTIALIRFYFNCEESFKQQINSEILKISTLSQPISQLVKAFFNSKIKFNSIEDLKNWLENQNVFPENKDLQSRDNQRDDFNENYPKRKLSKSDKNVLNQENSNEVEEKKLSIKKGKNPEREMENSVNFNEVNDKNIHENLKTNTSELQISSLYIDNAGLVILHPFLLNLFQKLNLCNNEVWIDKESQHKAVLLTQYLVTGQEVFFENELILNKLICGFPIESVINTKQKISKEEKEICNDLLLVVLEYWSVMKNSSVEALRETFLQRAGKLSLSETHPSELWVEEKGVDVLLASLPWGIGLVQTPWMNNFLHCYWN
ncbi:contractile injection system tape measure protein [Chryseobacterium aahli]|uniref:contractile injection system tape measure protein n=1 Tax=Chryseobacterium aahli TaxID=1278643 RepID=UPI001F61ABC7|nr:contractile injection system tape measure protein [Chryseobacterium aahli]MCI3939199.1 contractile injection system tape measure protein [Chryseobacterium aahli]